MAVWGACSREQGEAGSPARAGPPPAERQALRQALPGLTGAVRAPAGVSVQDEVVLHVAKAHLHARAGPELAFTTASPARSAGLRGNAGRAGQHQVVARGHKLAYVLVWRLDFARLQPSQPVQTRDALKSMQGSHA